MAMIFTLDQLQVDELVDTGSFTDAQDPALTIKIGKDSKTTDRKVDAKTKASFTESFTFNLTKQEFDAGLPLEVEVNNVNSGMFSKKVHIGKASLPLKSVLSKFNEHVSITINLVHDGKKGPVNQGKVIMRGKLDYTDVPPKQESAPAPTAAPAAAKPASADPTPIGAVDPKKPPAAEAPSKGPQPAQPVEEAKSAVPVPGKTSTLSTSAVTVRLVQVTADVRKNVEMMPGDLNDLYVVTKVGKKWAYSTQVRANAGLHAEWKYSRPDPQLSFSSTWAELATLEWVSQAVDHNDSVSHVVIGENTMTLSSEQVAGFSKSETLTFKVPLIDKSKKPIGEVEYIISSTALPSETPASAPVQSTAAQPAKPLDNNPVPAKSVEETKINPADRPTMQKVPSVDAKPAAAPEMTKVPELLKLIIEKIHVEDLLDTGNMFDKQDPSVAISVGSNSQETERIMDAGTKADFKERFEIALTGADYSKGITMEIEVSNTTKKKENTHLGHASLVVKSSLPSLGVPTPVRVSLMHKKGKEHGFITFMATLVEDLPQQSAPRSDKPSTSTIPADAPKEETKINPADRPTMQKVSAVDAKPAAAPEMTKVPELLKLIIEKIHVEDLLDTGNMFDKQDPSVAISVGSNSQETERIMDAGTKADFKERFEIALTGADYSKGITMEIEASNTTKKKERTHLGHASLVVKSSLPSLGVPTPVRVSLMHKKGKEHGFITFMATLVEDLPQQSASRSDKPSSAEPASDSKSSSAGSAPLSNDSQTVLIKSVVANVTKNVEIMMGDQNDLYTVTKLGEKFSHKTDVKDGAGMHAEWKYETSDVEAQFTASLAELSTLEWNVEVLDHNRMLAHTSIGVGKYAISAQQLAALPAKDLSFAIPLLDKKGKSVGEVLYVIGIKVAAPPRAASEKQPVEAKSVEKEGTKKSSEPFLSGTLSLTKIECDGLVNVEALGGKNDPFVELKLGTLTFKTESIDEAGATAVFDYLGQHFPVDRDILEFEKLKVKVVDKNNAFSDVLIGEGSTSLLYLIEHTDEEQMVTIQIANTKGKSTGRVKLYFTLSAEKPDDGIVDKNLAAFKKGELRILRIRAQDVPGIHHKTIHVNLRCADWEYATHSVDLSLIPVPLIDNLECNMPVHSSELAKANLVAEVVLHGMLGKSIVAAGSCNLKQCATKFGDEVEISMDLVHNGSASGRLIFFTRLLNEDLLKKEQGSVTIAEGFKKGYFLIDSLSLNGIKNTELFGGSQDPYVMLKFGEWKFQTKTKSGKGGDVEWEAMNVKLPLSREELESSQLEVTVMDDNTLRGDAKVGSGKLDLRQGCAVLEKTSSISISVLDDKGKKAGRLTFSGALFQLPDENATLELPKGVAEGFLRINKISGKDLKTGNFFSSPSPSIEVTYGGWKVSTTSSDNYSPIWTGLELESPTMTKELLSSTTFQLALVENKKVIATAEAPNLLLACSRFRQSTLMSFNLQHAKSKAPAGTIDVELCILPTDNRKIDTTKEIQVERKLDYTDAELNVRSIHLKGLRNTEWIGKADPFVIISFADWMEQTAIYKDAGSEVVWNDLSMRTDTTANDLTTKELEVTVYDKNSMRSNALIGKMKISLKRLAVSPGKEIVLTEQLLDQKGKPSGTCEIRAEVRKLDTKNLPKLPEELTSVELHCFLISAFDLKNTELIGKQDPFVILKVGEGKMQSPVQVDAGSDTIFENLDMRLILSKQALQQEELAVEVWDQNTVGNRLIGKGKASLRTFRTLKEEKQIPVSIFTADGSSAGRLLLAMKVDIPPPSADEAAAADAKIVVPPSFQTGWLDVVRIVAHGLRNTALLGGMLGGRQDPYVELSLGDWKDKSEVIENGDKDCTWDLLDLSAPVTADIVRTGTMTVVVKHKGTVRDEEIGSGTCKVIRAAGKMNEEVLVKVDLMDKKNKPAGKIELFLNLHEDEKDADYKIPKDFTYGVLKVTAVEAFHLKNTEFLGKQDPFVELKIGDLLKVKTFTRENAGVQASWEHLPYQCDLYREVLESTPLEIIVSDENTTRPNALIGKGSVNLVKSAHFLDKDTTINALIYDSKNKVSGKIRLHCRLSIPEPEADIPADFIEGTLRIMQVSAFGLQRTEFFGLSKTDPYAVVTVNGAAKKTKVLSNHGGNPSWEHLDFEYMCDNRTARVGEISVDLMEANSLTAHTKLGSASILVKKFGGKMGSVVDITGQLLNSKGQLSGEVVLKGQLEPRKAIAKVELGLSDDFTSGYISIVSLQAQGLKNTELLGKSDPYAKLEIGDWEETTTTLFGAGSNPSWPQLDCQAEVNRETLARHSLKVTFCDQNLTRGDKLIGFGSASLRPLCERVGKTLKLTIPISDSTGAVCGEAVVNAVLKKGDPSQMTEALPESAVVVDKGILKVLEVAAYDLGGGDKSIFDSKPDPYVVFQIGDSKDLIGRTSVLKDGGRNPRWSAPDIDLPVSRDILVFQRLNVLVMDKNNVSKDSFMGKGDISLRKAGSDASGKSSTYVIRLKDMRGRASGRLEIVASIEPLKDVANKEAAKEEFSQILGQLQIAEIEVSDARNTAMMGKQDLYVKLNFPTWTGQTDVNKGAGTKSKWNVKIDTKKVVAAHLQRNGLKVQVLSPGLTGDSVVGDCTIPMEVLIDNSNEFTELKHQLTYESKPMGKVRVKARFTTDEGQLQQWAKSAPQAENSAEASSAAINQELLRKQMSSMESSLKDQIKHELSKERKEMMAQLEAQNRELKNTIEKLSRSMSQIKQDNSNVSEIKDVELPKNIARWRTAHVQAWLAFELELPQYLEAFASASIDGLVLIRHVDEHILKDYMNITDILHSTKLLAGIETLKAKQQRYEEHVEKKHLAKLAEEEERKKRLEALKERDKKQEEDSKKPKKPKTFFGEVRESNLIDRARIEHSMTAYRADQQKKKDKADRKSKTWHFEYTGQPKPDMESVWDSKVDARIGSQSYQKAMTADIAKELAPIPTKIRTIPVNCSTDEVLAIIKGTMFEVSSWLLEVEQLNFKRRTLMDHDLLAMDLPDLPEYDQMMTDLAAAEEDEPLEDPPSYGEFASEAEELDDEENFSQTHEPPPYEDVLGESLTIRAPPASVIPPGKRTMLPTSLAETATAAFLSQQQPITDRMTLIFRALVKQQNNDARWLGANSKLTRLKLYGGIESLLRLRLEWSQFDTIWTKLDYKRSGDIDLHEFKQYFGDLSDFEQLEGTRSMTITSHAKSITTLTKTLYELCDALRHAKFTVAEMFSGFDRNGSGDVSVSEFCSMLRTVLGKSFDKKLIYQALSVLDMDGNKAISLEETLFFIYRIWRTQLDDLADKIYHLNEVEDASIIKKLLDERQAIKQAIKKNFPRQWRDKLEREGSGHAIPGPFANLLKKLHINDDKIREEVGDSAEFGRGSYPTMSTRPPAPPQQTSATPMLSPSRKPGRTYLAGKSTMLRFKVRLPPGTEHDRYRAAHTTSPPKKRLDNMVTMSAEGVHKLLTSSDPLGGFN